MGAKVEYRVVWRWRERWGHAAYPERRKTYKTVEGADRMLAKLRSNDGRYQKWDDPNDHGLDGEPSMVELVLAYSRLERREVGPWRLDPSEAIDA